MAGGNANQKPEAGINTTPNVARANMLHPSDFGSTPDDDLSSADTASPVMKTTKPNSTDHTTA